MKRLRPLFPLILIVSALLLSAATNASDELPRNHKADKSYAQADQKHAATKPIATISNQPSPEPPAQSNNQYTYNYNYYPVSQSPPVWFQVMATLALLGFTAGLWCTSIWQWRALQGALDVNRPILLFADVLLENLAPMSDEKPLPPPRATFALKNFGQGPAQLSRITAELVLVDDLHDLDLPTPASPPVGYVKKTPAPDTHPCPEIGSYETCMDSEIKELIIPPQKFSSSYIRPLGYPHYLDGRTIGEINTYSRDEWVSYHTTHLVLHALVVYESVLRKRYETEALWDYDAQDALGRGGFRLISFHNS